MRSRTTYAKTTILAAAALAGAGAPQASAQEPGVTLNPQQGSAPGSVYAIPTESGRADASPILPNRRSGSSSKATGTVGGGKDAPLKTENGNSSSSAVPGASGAGTSGGSTGSASGGGSGTSGSASRGSSQQGSSKGSGSKGSSGSGSSRSDAGASGGRDDRSASGGSSGSSAAATRAAEVRVSQVGSSTPSALVIVVLTAGLAVAFVVVSRAGALRRRSERG